ncbi:hypothetical protein SERLA73DRAFT_68342 [Serpula lacrymans var. lacrymans S7.3]|uniref:Uncharacterized protein n=2 Tax=Serpula lacrymans var. lacrymans TaxID=341189 RepID=F8PEZ1_SERL3|nr:uncharacterized protein SERLADRAFT_432090 [Serpula lacrymans var. lacrymans S7.9]EGO04664.1 hypothetical protein SERLA73DRAFT_68342 [Serpula lacrymans var. lacrymans S7.3]EGO30521.1 hypothetical protein SERLADRAFT_432090 [Serpula lacrymans var. lacrymans S7.9]
MPPGLELKHLKTLTSHYTSINALAFSPSAELLASGDDNGYLLVYATATWELLRRYQKPHQIQAILWHPHEIAISIGCSNGDISQILLSEHAENNQQWVNSVPGCVHVLDTTRDGTQLAVAYGNKAALVSQKKIGMGFGKDSPLAIAVKGSADHLSAEYALHS